MTSLVTGLVMTSPVTEAREEFIKTEARQDFINN